MFIPPGDSTIVPVGHEAIEHHIALEWLRERPTIPTPDSHFRVSASEFVHPNRGNGPIHCGWNRSVRVETQAAKFRLRAGG